LQKRSDEEIAEQFMEVLNEKGILQADDKFVITICGLLKNRVSFINQLWDQSYYFFKAPEIYDQEVVRKRWTHNTNLILKEAADMIENIEPYEPETINHALHYFIESRQLPLGGIMNCLRLSLVGASLGPDLHIICHLLGKREVINRILFAVEHIRI
jgi:glutamyl-tRNA synthetase